LAANCRGVLY
jgi:hypothetical protein